MDPYLEAPGLWPDFHEAFLTYARESLQPALPAGYYAQLRTREEIGIAGYQAERVIHPDVGPVVPAAAPGSTTVPDLLVIEPDERLEVSYLEIREVNDDRLVTLIEMLSPSNKIPGPDRKRFARKRKEMLESDTNWIEIDLLRSGKRSDPRVDLRCRSRRHLYVVVVSRGWKRHPLQLEIYGFGIREPLPVIAVPLREAISDVPLDLGHVFKRRYETGPYRKVVRYDLPPDPGLPPDEAGWTRELLRQEREAR
jgi:hypothetical protein